MQGFWKKKRDQYSVLKIAELRRLASPQQQSLIDQTFADDWSRAVALRMVLRGTAPGIAVRRVWEMAVSNPLGKPVTLVRNNPFGL
ncbi:MAG: hypothetical protein K2R98_13920 [Gemmataceae bacterium]|nr:hypothetical protein [Gemmataceae bacterium]